MDAIENRFNKLYERASAFSRSVADYVNENNNNLEQAIQVLREEEFRANKINEHIDFIKSCSHEQENEILTSLGVVAFLNMCPMHPQYSLRHMEAHYIAEVRQVLETDFRYVQIKEILTALGAAINALRHPADHGMY